MDGFPAICFKALRIDFLYQGAIPCGNNAAIHHDMSIIYFQGFQDFGAVSDNKKRTFLIF